MEFEVNKKYFKKNNCSKTAIRLITKIDSECIHYKLLHGSSVAFRTYKKCDGKCSVIAFRRWAEGEFVADDLEALDGCKIFKTYLVLTTKGDPLLRCTEKRARNYLKKGYVSVVGEGTLQFTNDTTETKLRRLYGEKLGEFFLTSKNDRCVICGVCYNLTRHHVIPRRILDKIPLNIKNNICNILFVCESCHQFYESQQLISESADPCVWKEHFISITDPKFLPTGWDIVANKRDSNDMGGRVAR